MRLNLIAKSLLCTVAMALVSVSLMGCKKDQKEEVHSPTNWLMGYSGEIRKAVIRIVVQGTPLDKIRFTAPKDFSKIQHAKVNVFHEDGGGARYLIPTEGYAVKLENAGWYFNGELEIPGLSDEQFEGSSELIAYFVGVTEQACLDTNKRLTRNDPQHAIDGIPKLTKDQSNLYMKQLVDGSDYSLPTDSRLEIASNAFDGSTLGCFESNDGSAYVFFSVLAAR